MKKLLLSLSFVAMSAVLFAQKPDDIAKFKQDVIDFGKIKQDVPKTATFYVTNIGELPLIIDKAEPTCGCTIGEHTQSPIARGKEGFIKATYNAKSLGVFTKDIKVRFAGVNDVKTITIKGEVLAPADYAKLAGKKADVKTKTDGNKTKTVTKANGVKTKTKVKTDSGK